MKPATGCVEIRFKTGTTLTAATWNPFLNEDSLHCAQIFLKKSRGWKGNVANVLRFMHLFELAVKSTQGKTEILKHELYNANNRQNIHEPKMIHLLCSETAFHHRENASLKAKRNDRRKTKTHLEQGCLVCFEFRKWTGASSRLILERAKATATFPDL